MLSVLTLQLTCCAAFPCGNYFTIYDVRLTLVEVTVLILTLVIFFPDAVIKYFMLNFQHLIDVPELLFTFCYICSNNRKWS